jgi:two-component system response regulator BaeR
VPAAGRQVTGPPRTGPAAILVVEDDYKTADTVALYLRHAGFAIAIARDGADGLARALAEPFDLVILDRMLPGMEGVEVCRRIRERSAVPVIVLTAVAGEHDRLDGFDAGADDYVVKPFSPRELVARVQAVLRRAEAKAERDAGVLRVGPLVLDDGAHAATDAGRDLQLSPTEYRLLRALAAAPGRAFSRRELVDRALDPESDADERVIDSHVKNLRRKLRETIDGTRSGEAGGRPAIRTVFGVGYRLVDGGRDA